MALSGIGEVAMDDHAIAIACVAFIAFVVGVVVGYGGLAGKPVSMGAKQHAHEWSHWRPIERGHTYTNPNLLDRYAGLNEPVRTGDWLLQERVCMACGEHERSRVEA